MEAKTNSLVILDYGSQYTQLIARRARELGVFSIILPFSATITEIQSHNPKAIILSGGPNSVYAARAPRLPAGLLDLGLPVLGICYGLQLLAQHFGGNVEASERREYGLATITQKTKSKLFSRVPTSSVVWMSHGDHVAKVPKGFVITAKSGNLICAIESKTAPIYGLQFHPEVTHSKHGQRIIENFIRLCKITPDWTTHHFADSKIDEVKKLVGAKRVICALSGGVDSSVAATLVDKAIGSQQTCIFVDTGLLRQGEYEEVLSIYKKIGLNVKPVRAAKYFLAALQGVDDPEQKRKIIGAEFIRIFEAEAKKLKNVEFLVQGTLYPDVIESVSVDGPSVTIKSHHNVGGLPARMKLKLLEPLRELFKDEVRNVGAEVGLPDFITQRQPFPGPGLAVRIIGVVTPAAIKTLQHADAIVREEVAASYQSKDLWQYFAVLLPVKSVGVMGDGRTYEQVIAVRAVDSTDGMTANFSELPHNLLANISTRIINEVKGVNRVVYDITSKPPGTIEWE